MSDQLAVYGCLALGLSSALVGGVFQSFSDFVMRGLAQAPASSGMQGMQGINQTVLRSVFLAMFLGLVPGMLWITGLAWFSLSGLTRDLIFVGAGAYVGFVFLVTVFANVPMNDELAALKEPNVSAADYWTRYVRDWTRWNHARTLGSIAASICLLLAAVTLAADPGSRLAGLD